MADMMLRTAVVLCGIALIPNSVDAQYGLRRTPHVLSIDEYDSDELVPMAPRVVPIANDGGFTRNYRSHPSGGKPTVLTPAEQLPLSDDLIEHLESLLRMAQQKQKRMRADAKRSKVEASQTEGKSYSTVTPMPTTSESINRTAPVSAEVTSTTPASSREIGKKWFPVLLQEAIENVLRQNDTDDELDELVDHIAAGSGTYRFETSPGDRYQDDFQQSNEHLNSQTRKYNLRRTFTPSISKEPSERNTSPTPPTSPTTTPEPDSFEEDELLHQATTNVFLKAKKAKSSRKQLQSGDASENRSGPLKLTFDTREDPLSSLFETDVGKGKRTSKKAGKKRHPWYSSEEMHDESRS
ncbi:AGAP013160-PA-like protein [Anopheles sinensis]|uniref:AGAP013160-PA-like protein n=1 Tax=Anopheles sinensis TaxID=74873 RepID=A0A084VY48_ANOSI|nr:AGAP013160-PA-like protein [Anopheles sinensis]